MDDVNPVTPGDTEEKIEEGDCVSVEGLSGSYQLLEFRSHGFARLKKHNAEPGDQEMLVRVSCLKKDKFLCAVSAIIEGHDQKKTPR